MTPLIACVILIHLKLDESLS